MQDYTQQDATQILRVENAAKRSFSTLALAFTAYIVVSHVAAVLLDMLLAACGFFSLPFIQQNISATSLVLGVLPLYLFGLPVLFLILRRLPAFPIEKQRVSLLFMLGTFAVSRFFIYAGSTVSQWITNAIFRFFHLQLTNTTEQFILNTPIWVLLIIVVLLGPIIEELIFRKLLIDRLAAFGDITAILFSATVFGLAHGNLFQFFYSFLIGLLLGYVYTQTGRLFPSICLHILINFFGSVAVLPIQSILSELEPYLLMSEEELILLMQSPEGTGLLIKFGIILLFSLATLSLVVVGAVIFLLHIKRVRRQLKTRLLSTVGGSRMASLAFANVGVPLFLAVSLAQFIRSFFF